ncbi:serine/threonine protein kinase [Plasmodium falciparum UGT5.1]|uniref:Serine/threonine protein kinase n=3 Tax=Plasmodium falciparum TaxID=5833 RepID=A0A024XEB8_PLAFC|nr:serine/threonine protein kinase [Plasmodium falciparum CAMP/Malaysia]EWC78982.1 serine/threonine protein kinase [Plasmodium falciparum UGT5.1]KNG78343.1 serine/threonine protein kinase [Plasmodium falciparum IGH-CR14]
MDNNGVAKTLKKDISYFDETKEYSKKRFDKFNDIYEIITNHKNKQPHIKENNIKYITRNVNYDRLSVDEKKKKNDINNIDKYEKTKTCSYVLNNLHKKYNHHNNKMYDEYKFYDYYELINKIKKLKGFKNVIEERGKGNDNRLGVSSTSNDKKKNNKKRYNNNNNNDNNNDINNDCNNNKYNPCCSSCNGNVLSSSKTFNMCEGDKKISYGRQITNLVSCYKYNNQLKSPYNIHTINQQVHDNNIYVDNQHMLYHNYTDNLKYSNYNKMNDLSYNLHEKKNSFSNFINSGPRDNPMELCKKLKKAVEYKERVIDINKEKDFVLLGISKTCVKKCNTCSGDNVTKDIDKCVEDEEKSKEGVILNYMKKDILFYNTFNRNNNDPNRKEKPKECDKYNKDDVHVLCDHDHFSHSKSSHTTKNSNTKLYNVKEKHIHINKVYNNVYFVEGQEKLYSPSIKEETQFYIQNDYKHDDNVKMLSYNYYNDMVYKNSKGMIDSLSTQHAFKGEETVININKLRRRFSIMNRKVYSDSVLYFYGAPWWLNKIRRGQKIGQEKKHKKKDENKKKNKKNKNKNNNNSNNINNKHGRVIQYTDEKIQNDYCKNKESSKRGNHKMMRKEKNLNSSLLSINDKCYNKWKKNYNKTRKPKNEGRKGEKYIYCYENIKILEDIKDRFFNDHKRNNILNEENFIKEHQINGRNKEHVNEKNKEEDTFNISKENTKEGSYIITHKNKRNMDNIKIGRYDNINDKKEFSSNILYKCVKKNDKINKSQTSLFFEFMKGKGDQKHNVIKKEDVFIKTFRTNKSPTELTKKISDYKCNLLYTSLDRIHKNVSIYNERIERTKHVPQKKNDNIDIRGIYKSYNFFKSMNMMNSLSKCYHTKTCDYSNYDFMKNKMSKKAQNKLVSKCISKYKKKAIKKKERKETTTTKKKYIYRKNEISISFDGNVFGHENRKRTKENNKSKESAYTSKSRKNNKIKGEEKKTKRSLCSYKLRKMKHLCVENKMHIKKNVRQIIKKKKKNIYKTIKCLNSYKTLIDQVNVKGDEEHKLSNHVNNKKKKKKNCINENNDDNNNDNYNDNNDDNNNDNYNDNNNDNYNDNNNDHNDHNDHNNNDNNNDLNNDHRNDNNQREHSCEEINIQNVEQKCEGEKYEGKRKNKYTYYNNYYKINGKNEIHDDYNIKSHGSRINYNIFNIKDNKHNNNDKGEKSCELKKCSIPYVKEKYNLENNTYEIIGLIYYGDKSQVYKCINMNNKRVYAMKVVLKECNEIFVDNFIKKYLFLKNNPHKNIISIYDIFCNNNYICIIMDYCEGSTLLDYFMSLVPGSLDVYEIKKIMKNIFIALDFFHSNNIIHRDIKLENIMFKNKKRKKKRFNYEKYGSFLFNNHEEISFSTSCSNLHKKDLQLRGMDTIGKKIMGGKKFIRNLYNEKHKNLNIFQKNCSHILKKNTKKNILSNDIQLKSPKCYIKYNNNMDTLFNYEDDSNWSYNSSICYDIIQVSDEEEYDNVNIKDKLYEYNMCTDSSRYERIVNYENSIHSHNPYGTNSKYETFCDDAFPSQICSIHNYNKKGGRYNFSKLYKNKKNMKSNMNPSFSDLCIIDMDMIEIVSKTKFPGINKSKIICGTPPYMPPESFDGIVSPGNDIWACGVILYVLMDGRFPYEINNYMPIHLKKKILMENKPKFEPFIWKQHTDLLDLCLRLLDPNPWTRIQNAREALIHYSFRDLI